MRRGIRPSSTGFDLPFFLKTFLSLPPKSLFPPLWRGPPSVKLKGPWTPPPQQVQFEYSPVPLNISPNRESLADVLESYRGPSSSRSPQTFPPPFCFFSLLSPSRPLSQPSRTQKASPTGGSRPFFLLSNSVPIPRFSPGNDPF